MAKRPSHKELTGKLNQAVEALTNGRYAVVEEERHFTSDRDEFQSGDSISHLNKVFLFLHEIIEAGGVDCYVGRYPPFECYHGPYKGVELFAFAWDSPSEGKRLYLKFGIRLSKKTKEPTYVYLNCHEDAPEKRDR